MKNLSKIIVILFLPSFIILSLLFSSCDEQNDGLAPYAGSPALSGITVQDSTFWPKITWLGGYVTVLGVNQGSRAAIDASLVFLIHKAGNGIKYPVTFNQVPADAQDLTGNYGGSRIDSLIEDSTYTFWVMREAEWNQISSLTNKTLVFDSTLAVSLQVDGDTVRLSGENYSEKTNPINVYINITDLRPRGRLADIFIQQTNTSNNPIITWQIKQPGVTDSLISAIGIVEAGQYDVDAEVWSVLSVSDSAGVTQYAKANVIAPPVTAGETFPGTQVFVEYPAGGLKKNSTYYVWIANKFWDGEGRILSTNYYAYITFNTK